jgi:hypothetical protein
VSAVQIPADGPIVASHPRHTVHVAKRVKIDEMARDPPARDAKHLRQHFRVSGE